MQMTDKYQLWEYRDSLHSGHVKCYPSRASTFYWEVFVGHHPQRDGWCLGVGTAKSLRAARDQMKRCISRS